MKIFPRIKNRNDQFQYMNFIDPSYRPKVPCYHIQVESCNFVSHNHMQNNPISPINRDTNAKPKNETKRQHKIPALIIIIKKVSIHQFPQNTPMPSNPRIKFNTTAHPYTLSLFARNPTQGIRVLSTKLLQTTLTLLNAIAKLAQTGSSLT